MKTTKAGCDQSSWYMEAIIACPHCGWEGHFESVEDLNESNSLIIDKTLNGGRSIVITCPNCMRNATWSGPAPRAPITVPARSTHPRFAELESEQAEAFSKIEGEPFR